jgi:hypothetical protein
MKYPRKSWNVEAIKKMSFDEFQQITGESKETYEKLTGKKVRVKKTKKEEEGGNKLPFFVYIIE